MDMDINLTDESSWIDRWSALCAEERDVAFRKIQYARELRDRFIAGPRGDGHFKEWCQFKLGMSTDAAAEMLTAAIAGRVFADAASFKGAGGWRDFKCIAAGEASKPSLQEEILRTARDENLTVASVFGRRFARKRTKPTTAQDVASRIARSQPLAEAMVACILSHPKPDKRLVRLARALTTGVTPPVTDGC